MVSSQKFKDPDFDQVKAGIEPGAAWWKYSALPSEVYYIIGFGRLKLEKLWLNNLVVILSVDMSVNKN